MLIIIKLDYLNDLIETKKEFLNEDEIRDIDSELRTIDIILNPSTPELWLNPEVTNFYDFTPNDIKVKGYPKALVREKNPQLDFPLGI